nr:RNA-directed DNA polymerase, eukaryota, reverse transcriptase zinc-binding domain protein [Tanacetum cinerariifolium]
SFSAKDLFQSCKQHGHVVDSFIPLKRSKEGKRFGFVRFINVFSVERLVKEFASLSNLKMVLTNEGFVDISVRYMGELWVLLEFASTKSKELFRYNVGVGSWFFELKQASFDLNPDGRVVRVEVEGVPFKFWSGNTFKRLATKWGELLDVFWVRAKEVPGWVPELLEESDEEVQYARSSGDNSEVAEVLKTNFDESIGPKVNLSDDPFGIYPLLNKNSKENKENVNEKDQSLEYPPEVYAGRDGDSTNRGSKGDASESTPNAEEKDRNVNGNKSQKCNTKEVLLGEMRIVLTGVLKGMLRNLFAPGETKMENMELHCVRSCWGNYAFDYIHSNSVGNSGGILCAWDPTSFRKSNYTISDSVVIIRGVLLKNGIDLLIVAVYAPHDPRDKRADEFNSFIANAGLEEVPLGESAFTWCHKSATKMSKLDRFLISENLFITCPHITTTTLERYLSDHRPILLHETSNDYGPVSF